MKQLLLMIEIFRGLIKKCATINAREESNA